MPSDDEFDDSGWLDNLNALGLDELIEQITVDAYGDEGYWSFRQAFEDHLVFPALAFVVGTDVTVTDIDFDGDERRGLTATVRRDGRTWTVSILDLEIPAEQLRLSRLTHAYRRWLGMDR